MLKFLLSIITLSGLSRRSRINKLTFVKKKIEKSLIYEMTTIFPSSNFQSALIFIQIIALPFFIVLLIIHIQFGGIWTDSEPCSNFCRSKPSNRHYFIPISEETSPSTVPPINIISKSLISPSIGALLEKVDSSLKFKCIVAMFSKDTALCTEECLTLKQRTLIRNLRVRIGSENWKENGIVIPVDKITFVLNRSPLPTRFAFLKFKTTPLIESKIIPIKIHDKPKIRFLTPSYYFFNEKFMLDQVVVEIEPDQCCEMGEHHNREVCIVKIYNCDLVPHSLLLVGKTLVGIHVLTASCPRGTYVTLKTGTVKWNETVEADQKYY